MASFTSLVETSQRVSATSARKQKIRELAAFLRKLLPEELETAVNYLSGDITQGRIGIGHSALRATAGHPAASSGILTIAAVDRALAEIAVIHGPRSAARRCAALIELFSTSTAAEQNFLVRLLSGELRQGALIGVMVDAIAAAADLEVAPVRRAAMYSKSLGTVARMALLEGVAGLARVELTLFQPVYPMLAQTAADTAEALEQLAGELAFEWKPEIVEVARHFPHTSVVLDGEAIAVDAGGRPHPFQITMRRFGRKLNISELRAELPIQAFFFDCLYVDGHGMTERPTHERHAALLAVVPSTLLVPRIVTASQSDAAAFYDAAIAAGHEGVMAKSLDAPYEAGNRGASWLKIKRAHTLDLLVLAAEWGHGRRTGLLSNLHLGALDPATNEYVMLGKTFKGLTDAMLQWQTQELLARETHRDSAAVYVRPELVVEIAFSDLQTSTRYPGGLALRLARVKRFRDDKTAADADTMESVRKIAAVATPAG